VAQERNEVNASHSETDEIRHEIQRAASKMGETIGEIQERLRPDHLIQQAKDNVREAATGKAMNIMHSVSETAHGAAERARGVGNHLAWYAQAHPIRIAITAGVVTWLLLRNRDTSSHMWYGESDTSWDSDREDYLAADTSARGRVGEYASSARQAVSDYAASARETASDYASTARETVNEYAASAASTARSATRRVGTAARSGYQSADAFVHSNPLAAGAIAAAVGIAVGLSAPATEYEDTLLGETRDQALQKAKAAASNITENVTNKVATMAENVVGESVRAAAAEPPMGRV
jgi:ElaB/YqjD/DUF883 family membrane-anchored ribosome-binding protein